MEDTSSKSALVLGQQLVTDFKAALISSATVELAKREAERSEAEITGLLSYVSNGSFLNPSALTTESQSAVTRASVDAHVKKIQAQQMELLNAGQLAELSERDQMQYGGRKVRVGIIDYKQQPVESVWSDPHLGYRKGVITKGGVAGTIDQVLLTQNLLVLKPTGFNRLLNRQLLYYIVYVMHPETLEPLVQLEI